MKKHLPALCMLLLIASGAAFAQPIDRRAVVERHIITTNAVKSKSPAQVGNGHFAFGMDITGLQTFTAFNTLSDWGWHSEPLPEGKTPADYHPQVVETHGKAFSYMLNDPDEPEITNWLKCNPHRINLGRVAFVLLKEDGTQAAAEDLEGASQTVDIWTGEVTSTFSIEGKEVKVRTSCHPEKDAVALRVDSPLIAEGRLSVAFSYPYSETNWMSKYVGDYNLPERHGTTLKAWSSQAVISHRMDSTTYFTGICWKGEAAISSTAPHTYVLVPGGDRLEMTFTYSEDASVTAPDYDAIAAAQAKAWEQYWMSGAAVDLSGSSDPRWKEFERRIVLSQYQMRLNESGLYPPQEAGLVNDGWYGRFHWEMIWWHAAHYLLWGRSECAQYLDIYKNWLPSAKERAALEGRKGARWPKCTGNFNREWPNDTHAWLLWQEPHPIWFAEQMRRSDPGQQERWKEVVFATADYMADCLFKEGKTYVMGPPLVLVSENTKGMDTANGVFELCYFRYGLRTAIEWAERLGEPRSRSRQWRKVLSRMAPLPVEDGYYITHEGMQDMWHKYNFEHPALAGVYGWLPGDGVDTDTFRKTYYRILTDWQLDKAWGWDYAVLAMAAARLGDPQKAVDLLTTTAHKFAFDEHGLADCWPFPYFPANGGLLTAVAMMCEGWDGSEGSAPGFPQNGSWSVRYEGFNKMQ